MIRPEFWARKFLTSPYQLAPSTGSPEQCKIWTENQISCNTIHCFPFLISLPSYEVLTGSRGSTSRHTGARAWTVMVKQPSPSIQSCPFPPFPSLAAAGTANGLFLTSAVGFYCFSWASIGLHHSILSLELQAPQQAVALFVSVVSRDSRD